jgi:hypothetical protein
VARFDKAFVLPFPILELLVFDLFDLNFFRVEASFFEILLFDVIRIFG